MRPRPSKIIFSALIAVLLATLAQAESRYRVVVKTQEILSGRPFSLSVPSLGVVRFSLARQDIKNVRVTNGERLVEVLSYTPLNGLVSTRARQRQTSAGNKVNSRAAAIIAQRGDRKYLSIHFSAQGVHGRVRFYRLTGELIDGQSHAIMRLYRVPAVALSGKHCAAELLPFISGSLDASASKSGAYAHIASTVQFVEISFDADQQFSAKYGSNAAAEIAATVNAVNVIYQTQLALELSLVQAIIRQNSTVYPNSITEIYNGSNGMIEQFTARVNGSSDFSTSDAYHMLSARDYSPYLGIAWQQNDNARGVVCRDRSRSMGVSSAFFNSAVTHMTVAHELAHNLSAQHGPNGDNAPFTTGIMSPVLDLNDLPTSFSSFSVGEIANYVAANGSCLASGESTPAPTPTSNANSPTATPATTPQATPTVSGGGGGGGVGTDPNVPTATPNLSSTLTLSRRGGVVNLNISRRNSESCALSIVGASKNSKLRSAGKAVYSLTETTASAIQLKATLRDKVIRPKSGATPKGFLGVVETCASGVYYSDSVAIKFSDARSGKGRSVNSWLVKLGKLLS